MSDLHNISFKFLFLLYITLGGSGKQHDNISEPVRICLCLFGDATG